MRRIGFVMPGVLALATALGLVITSGSPALAAGHRIQIREIYYNPPGPDTGSNSSLNHEWVQSHNTSGHRITLTHWTLRGHGEPRLQVRDLQDQGPRVRSDPHRQGHQHSDQPLLGCRDGTPCVDLAAGSGDGRDGLAVADQVAGAVASRHHWLMLPGNQCQAVPSHWKIRVSEPVSSTAQARPDRGMKVTSSRELKPPRRGVLNRFHPCPFQ